jgi:hypothetical protein
LRPIPNLEDQVPVFMPPSNKAAQSYSQAPGSLFVAFYNPQVYGGGILTRLHTGALNTVNVINSKTVRWVRHVERMEAMGNPYKMLG